MKAVIKIAIAISLILAITGVYLNYNYRFWTRYKTDNFNTLIEYNGSHVEGLYGQQILIHKDFEKYMRQIDEYAVQSNVEVHIVHAYRSNENELSNTIVEPAEYSNHKAGHAIDFNLKYKGDFYNSKQLSKRNLKNQPQPIQNFIEALRKNKALRWGGDFGEEDPIHIDFPLNITNRSRWQNCSDDCRFDYDRRIPIWQIWK